MNFKMNFSDIAILFSMMDGIGINNRPVKKWPGVRAAIFLVSLPSAHNVWLFNETSIKNVFKSSYVNTLDLADR